MHGQFSLAKLSNSAVGHQHRALYRVPGDSNNQHQHLLKITIIPLFPHIKQNR